MGIPNFTKNCHVLYTFSTCLWPGSSLPIECQIASLQIVVELLPGTIVEEECLLYLNQLDETHRDAELALEAHKHRVKTQYDKKVKPRSYEEGDLVLLYDKKHDLLGAGTLQPLWIGPYVVKKALSKGAYELQDWEGVCSPSLEMGSI